MNFGKHYIMTSTKPFSVVFSHRHQWHQVKYLNGHGIQQLRHPPYCRKMVDDHNSIGSILSTLICFKTQRMNYNMLPQVSNYTANGCQVLFRPVERYLHIYIYIYLFIMDQKTFIQLHLMYEYLFSCFTKIMHINVTEQYQYIYVRTLSIFQTPPVKDQKLNRLFKSSK